MRKQNHLPLILRVLFIILAYLVLAAHAMRAQSTPPDWRTEKNNTWSTGIAVSTKPFALAQAHSSPIKPSKRTSAANWLMTIYQTDVDGNWEIYQYKWLGSIRLTTNSAADTSPRLNFGATQIVFVSDRDGNSEIYRMNADGSNQTRLTTHPALDITPAWSPDGKQIVFSSMRDKNLEIYSMQQDGSRLRRLTNLSGNDFAPDWSPDGQQIVWVHTVAKDQGELWIMNADGGNPHPLVSAKRYLQHPVWSPNGTRIAFDYDTNGDGFNELALVNRDGSGLQNSRVDGADPHDEWMGSWAPDETSLYFTYIGLYLQDDDQLVPGPASIHTFCLDRMTDCSVLDEDLVNPSLPDVKSRDPWAPTSYVEKLANFSRRSSFNVYWRGHDQGPSGIHGYDLQYRLATNSAWKDWISGTNPDPVIVDPDAIATEREAGSINSLPAGKVYFRSRAIDRADNLEAWPSSNTGDASTTVFRWLLQGRVTDARNNAQALLPIPLGPAPLNESKTDSTGKFMAYLGDSGQYQLNQSIPLTLNSDYARDFYILPQDNLVHDGGFEEANLAQFWQANNLPGAQLSAGPPHTGQHSVTLGQPCPTGCLSPLSPSGADTHVLRLLTDPRGNLHVFSQKGNSLYHQVRQENGEWQPYTVLANGDDMTFWTTSATFDQQANLHIIWNKGGFLYTKSEEFYAMRSVDGHWSTPLSLGIMAKHKLVIDSTNRLHLFYICINFSDCSPQQLRYRTRSPDGVWSADQLVVTAWDFYSFNAISTADNTVHLFWSAASETLGTEQLLYRPFMNGNWGTQQLVDEGFRAPETGRIPYTSLELQVDTQQMLHVAWTGTPANLILYRTKPRDGEWSITELLGADTSLSPIWDVRMRLDANDNIHLLGLRAGFRQPLYWHKKLGQNWSTPHELNLFSADNQYFADLAVSASHGKYVAMNDHSKSVATLLAEEQATRTVDSQISQTVTLPATIHRPTLAFMYQLEGGATGQSAFNVTVTNGVTTTTVFSTNQLTPWALGWADLAAWQGQSITVTFGVHQAANEPYLHVDLDEITVSAWQTPLIQESAPAQIETGASATLIILGENFIATPTVKLGETTLGGVRWVNEQRLEVPLPSNLAPGIYDLLISNPTGEMTRHVHALAVGKQIYLPIIERQ